MARGFCAVRDFYNRAPALKARKGEKRRKEAIKKGYNPLLMAFVCEEKVILADISTAPP